MKKLVDAGSGLFVGMWWNKIQNSKIFSEIYCDIWNDYKYEYKFIKDLATLCTVYIIATDLLML